MNTFYISKSGDDAADGLSAATAWRSLERALQEAYGDGDRLLLEGGSTFEGSLLFAPNSGGVYIGSFGEGRARIDAGEHSGIVALNRSLTVENLEIVGGWNRDTQAGNDAHGVMVQCNLEPGRQLGGVTLRNLKISGFRNAGIGVYDSGAEVGQSGFQSVLIEQCETHDNGVAGIAK